MKRDLMKFATIAAITAGMAFAQQAPANSPAPQNATGQSEAPAKVPAHRAGRMHRQKMQALNLTDVQKQQARTIFQETRKSTGPIRAQLRQNRQAMAGAVKANDTAQIQKLSKNEGELMGQLIAARGEARARFYNLLTPEQRAQADKLHSAMRHRIERRRAEWRSNG